MQKREMGGGVEEEEQENRYGEEVKLFEEQSQAFGAEESKTTGSPKPPLLSSCLDYTKNKGGPLIDIKGNTCWILSTIKHLQGIRMNFKRYLRLKECFGGKDPAC